MDFFRYILYLSLQYADVNRKFLFKSMQGGTFDVKKGIEVVNFFIKGNTKEKTPAGI